MKIGGVEVCGFRKST